MSPMRVPARLAALVVALGVLLAQAVQVVELAVVRHAPCEHGELVHAEREPPRAASRDVQIEAGRARLAEHEHCDLAVVHHRASDVAVRIADARILVLPPLRGVARAGAHRQRSLLSDAPKSSPPRVRARRKET